MGPLRTAGIATVAFDAFGCGSSAKPRDPLAYAPGELYADLEAIYKKHCKVSTGHAGNAKGRPQHVKQASRFQGKAWQRCRAAHYKGLLLYLQVLYVPLQNLRRQAGHKHLQ